MDTKIISQTNVFTTRLTEVFAVSTRSTPLSPARSRYYVPRGVVGEETGALQPFPAFQMFDARAFL